MAKTLAAAVLVLMLCAFGTAHADLITNGDFLPYQTGGSGFTTISVPASVLSKAIPGWTVTAGSVDWIGSYWTAPGTGSIDLDGNAQGAIKQILSTTAGQAYDVTFFLSANPDGGPATKQVTVSAAGAPTLYSFTGSGNTHTNMGFIEESFLFTATGSNTALTFASGTPGAYGAVIANVSAAPVPIPATLLFFGPGLAGLVALRKKFKI